MEYMRDLPLAAREWLCSVTLEEVQLNPGGWVDQPKQGVVMVVDAVGGWVGGRVGEWVSQAAGRRQGDCGANWGSGRNGCALLERVR